MKRFAYYTTPEGLECRRERIERLHHRAIKLTPERSLACMFMKAGLIPAEESALAYPW